MPTLQSILIFMYVNQTVPKTVGLSSSMRQADTLDRTAHQPGCELDVSSKGILFVAIAATVFFHCHSQQAAAAGLFKVRRLCRG